MGEEFKAITTQEELNAVIGERLKRERGSTEKRISEQYAGYVSKAQHESDLADLTKQLESAASKAKEDAASIAALNSKVSHYETASVKSRIAQELGLPHELASRLTGADEAAWREDAETLKKVLGSAKAPAATAEPVASTDAKTAAYKQMLDSMRNE